MIQKNETINLPMALIIGLNAAIGAGIFTAPLPLHRIAGAAGIFSYLIVTAIILCIGLALTKLLRLHPTPAFFYDLPKLWGGRLAGLTATYLYSSGLVVALGLLGKIAGTLLSSLFPSFSPTIWTIILLCTTALSSQMGTSWLTWGQYILFFLTIAPMAIIAFLGFSFGHVSNFLPFAPNGISGILAGTPIVAFGFFGFEAIPALFTRIKNPEKNIVRAISGTILITGIVYLIFIASIFMLLPEQAYTNTSLGEALVSALPAYNWLIQTITWAIIITIAGTLYSMFPAISAILLQAHRNNNSILLEKSLITGIPITAIIVAISASNIGLLFNITAVGITGAFGLSILPLLTNMRTKTDTFLGINALCACIILLSCAIIGIIQAP